MKMVTIMSCINRCVADHRRSRCRRRHRRQSTPLRQSCLWQLWLLLLVLLSMFCGEAVQAIQWDHAVHLNADYRLMWTLKQQDITFEVQVRTAGYVGLGFSPDGAQSGADMAIGWIDQGQTYFQDRHMKKTGDGEPLVDPQQDYELLLGYENATHTVMRFRRKLNTCDTAHDIVITNDTMRIIYMYHSAEPRLGSILPGSLPSPQSAYRGYVPLSLTQRVAHSAPPQTVTAVTAAAAAALTMSAAQPVSAVAPVDATFWLELRHEDVELPAPDETHFWCRVFELPDFRQRHHLIRYEPVFETPRSTEFLQQIVLYECQGAGPQLVTLSRRGGHVCNNHNNPAVPCNAVVAVWTRGSQGFTFPPDAGYPFESAQDRFFLMESHYNNPIRSESDWEAAMAAQHLGPVVDNSGLKLMFTTALRKHDAGVVSIGMDPNWRHIIPPGHSQVISEGHCIDECTQRVLPAAGISIFAVLMQTYNIGSQIRLRQIRKRDELPPIAVDGNVHAAYAEFRRVTPAARVLPGDNLIVECTYNSSGRDTITLGDRTTRGETCNAMVVYYPRQKQLATCGSVPSLPTVLHSVGIEELSVNSQPVLITKPLSLAGMSLEDRLLSYDWKQQFESFQSATRRGSFRAVCLDAENNVMKGTDVHEHYRPTVTKFWAPATTGSATNACPASASSSADDPAVQRADSNSNNVYVTEMTTRRKNFADNAVGTGHDAQTDDADNNDDADAEVESMSLSGSGRLVATITATLPLTMWPLWQRLRHVNVLFAIT